MKILYLIDQPNLYGSEQHLLRLIDMLQEQYELNVLSFNDGPLLNLIRKRGVPVSVLSFKWYSLYKVGKFSKFLKTGKFDLVHAHQPKALLWGSIMSKLTKIPCIITIHSLPSSNIQSYVNPFKKMVVGMFHYSVKEISELLATKIVYLSIFSCQYTRFKTKAVIIPNWVDGLVDEQKIKKGFNKIIQFVSVGSVTFNKGMDRMISALALIKEQSWTVDIIGSYEGAYKDQLEQQARGLGIADRISFLGHLDNLDEWLLKSDGFILLSRGETFGLVFIEAMNCGLPVIAWNIPVVKEIIPTGNLILQQECDIKQAFPRFYSKVSDFNNISSTNRSFVANNFTAANVKEKYTNLYAEILYNSRN